MAKIENAKAEKPTKAEKPKKEPVVRDIQNGVTKPGAGTLTRKVWDIAEKISTEKKDWATRKEVIEACEKAGINKATAQTQYGKWATYRGMPKQPRAKKEAPEAAEE